MVGRSRVPLAVNTKLMLHTCALPAMDLEPLSLDNYVSSAISVFFKFFFGIHETVKSNIAMENGPFEDVFPIKHGDIPLLC